MRLKNLLVVIIPSVLSVGLLSNAHAQNGDTKPLTDLPRQFSATAFADAGVMAGKSFGLDVYINAWTTDQQVKDYSSVLKEKGPDGLVGMMEKADDVGQLSPTGFVGSGFRFARYRQTPNGGLHIVMVTNRPMSFGELYRSGRSTDYQFGILVLDVDKDGKGTGKLAPICKIKFDKRTSWRSRTTARNPSASQTYLSRNKKKIKARNQADFKVSLQLFVLPFGGAERDRTADLLVANEALSQLSYSPPLEPPHRASACAAHQDDISECTSTQPIPQSSTCSARGSPHLRTATSAHSPRHRRSRGQRLLHHMPHLAVLIHHHAKHRNHQPRSTPRHRLQHTRIPCRKHAVGPAPSANAAARRPATPRECPSPPRRNLCRSHAHSRHRRQRFHLALAAHARTASADGSPPA